MNTIELEARKALLAREILCEDNETVIDKIWLLLQKSKLSITKQQAISQKREIGFLEGKAKATFHNDWSMTPEELDMV
jgi:exonuclease V gamma subunit